ncbi:MAG: hypothetical protein WKF93_06995 [Acidimicrobiales bacterium]
MRVLADVPAVERRFDYLVPDTHVGTVAAGAMVRIDLHGRRVGGWVVEVDVDPPPGVALKPLARVSGVGPPAAVVDLAGWAAHRWAGRTVHLLRTASPPAVVSTLPAAAHHRGDGAGSDGDIALAAELLAAPGAVVVRQPPAADRWPLLAAIAAAGPALVIVPSPVLAARLADRLRRAGLPAVALVDDGTPTARARAWATAAAGGSVVVGSRSAVWAPCPDHGPAGLRSIVVVDEHDEAHQGQQAPTWHARDVAVERARRAGVPCLLVSSVPSLAAIAHGAAAGRAPHVPNTAVERAGWPVVEVVDRRDEDPTRGGLWSPRVAELLADRGRGRVVALLNRTGRAQLLACASCGAVDACDRCGAVVGQPEPGRLVCRACAAERPVVCLGCGGSRMKLLRAGVARAVEELSATLREPVLEVTGATPDDAVSAPGAPRALVGTEAVLHRLPAASVGVVAVLDLDQELLAPRFRAAEHALAVLARAARAVGGRAGDGRLVLQTRWPEHPVVQAALRADPDLVAGPEARRRAELGYPPAAALAVVSGAAGPQWAEAAARAEAAGIWPAGTEVLGPADGRWLVRAPDPDGLADVLASVERPPGRLRIEVDPPRA